VSLARRRTHGHHDVLLLESELGPDTRVWNEPGDVHVFIDARVFQVSTRTPGKPPIGHNLRVHVAGGIDEHPGGCKLIITQLRPLVVPTNDAARLFQYSVHPVIRKLAAFDACQVGGHIRLLILHAFQQLAGNLLPDHDDSGAIR
jgi:hypothetical protein